VSLNPGGIPLAASADYTPRVGRVSRWLLLALLAWWTARFAFHPLDDSFVNGSFLHLVNLPFHEAGHVLFSPFGRFMTILGGSLMQVLVPVVCAVSFGRRHDWFATMVCVWWAGQNLVDLAPYIGDARALQLVLLGGFTGPRSKVTTGKRSCRCWAGCISIDDWAWGRTSRAAPS
jgi:hypothetical protein